MRIEISRLQKRLGVTTIYVTHDQTEAMTMADRIAVMKDGLLQQFDTPVNMYNHPVNLFVAGFIGSPSMNFIHGRMDENAFFRGDNDALNIQLNDFLPSRVKSGPVILGIRPENIHGDNGLGISSYYPVEVMAETVEPMGSDSYLYFKIGKDNFIARLRPETTPAEGQSTMLFFDRSKLYFFHPDTGERIS